MAAEIMYGAPIAENIVNRVMPEVEFLRRTHGIVPRLDVILAGQSPSSQIYVNRKVQAFAQAGIHVEIHAFSDDVSAAELLACAKKLSNDAAVHGIMVELPLPMHIENAGNPDDLGKFAIFDAIKAEKDVDGVSRHSIPELYRGQQKNLMFLPSTALAVKRMLDFHKIETEGKRVVVVGRNDITAKPIHYMLGGRMGNATVVWCHRFTPPDVHDAFVRTADIVVTCVGNEKYKLMAGVVKPGAAIIDVGTRTGPDGRLHGDVDFESVKDVAGFLTPVPKGVGPVTVACLMENLIRAARFCVGIDTRGYEF